MGREQLASIIRQEQPERTQTAPQNEAASLPAPKPKTAKQVYLARWMASHPENVRANNRRYHHGHKDQINESKRLLYATDSFYREQTRSRVDKRRQRKRTDPEFKAQENVRDAGKRRQRYQTDPEYRFQRKLADIRYEEREEERRRQGR